MPMPAHLELTGEKHGKISFAYEKMAWTWEVDGIESEDSWTVPIA